MEIRSPLQKKLDQLLAAIRSRAPIAVAYSGGVDSTFLLWAAKQAQGSVNAIMVHSAFSSRAELEEAREVAVGIGATLSVLEVDVFDNPQIVKNSPERCYHCKRALFSEMLRQSQSFGCLTLADGSNADDANEYRPGMRALAELSIWSPLREMGITKAEVRALSQSAGLPTAQKPSMACLATRFPYGTQLTNEGLRRVEKAEARLRAMGYSVLRVRSHGEVARIEIEKGMLPQAVLQADEIVAAVTECGYTYAALDLRGFQSGSMDRAMKEKRA